MTQLILPEIQEAVDKLQLAISEAERELAEPRRNPQRKDSPSRKPHQRSHRTGGNRFQSDARLRDRLKSGSPFEM